MADNSEERIRKWVLEFFAVLEDEYGHAPERLNMSIRLENGAEVRIHRTQEVRGSSPLGSTRIRSTVTVAWIARLATATASVVEFVCQ